jgi:hypothetical protein
MDIASLFSTPSASTGTAASSNLLAGDAGAAVVNAEGLENFNRLLMSFLDQSTTEGDGKTQSSKDKAASLFGESLKQNQAGTATTTATTTTTTGTATASANEGETGLSTGFNQLPRQVRAAVPDMRWQQAGLNLLAMNQADTTTPALSDEVTSFLNDLSTLMRQQGLLSGKDAASVNGEGTAATQGLTNAEDKTAAATEPDGKLAAGQLATSSSSEQAAPIPTLALTAGNGVASEGPAVALEADTALTGASVTPEAGSLVEGQHPGVKASPRTSAREGAKGEPSGMSALAPAPTAPQGQSGSVANAEMITSAQSGTTLALQQDGAVTTATPDDTSPVSAPGSAPKISAKTGEASLNAMRNDAVATAVGASSSSVQPAPAQIKNGGTGTIPLPSGMTPAGPGDRVSAAAGANQPAAPSANAATLTATGTTAATGAGITTVTSASGVTTGDSAGGAANTSDAGSSVSVGNIAPDTPKPVATDSPKGNTGQPVVNQAAHQGSKAHDKHSQQPLNGLAKNGSTGYSTANGNDAATATAATADSAMDADGTDEQDPASSAGSQLAAAREPTDVSTDLPPVTDKSVQPPVTDPVALDVTSVPSVAALDRETVITGETTGTNTIAAPLASGASRNNAAAAGSRPQSAPAVPSGDAAADADGTASADASAKETGKDGEKSHRVLPPQHTDPENTTRAVADQGGERPQATTRPGNGNIGSSANNAAQGNLLSQAVGASDGTAGGELGSESQGSEAGTLGTEEGSLSLAAEGSKTSTTDFTQHLRQASAPTGSQRPGATPTATYQVALQVQRATQDGNDKISIQLRPYDLGRVDVQLEFNNDGKLRAKVTADSIQTLELLQKDSRNLERALQEAGLKTDQSSLSFSLRDDNDQAQRQQQQGQQEKKSGTRFANIQVEEEIPAVPAYRPVIGPGRVDVRI